MAKCCGLVSTGSRYGAMADCCEDGNEPSVPIKGGKFLGLLTEY